MKTNNDLYLKLLVEAERVLRAILVREQALLDLKQWEVANG